MNPQLLKGQSAIVTGASRGIGAGIAKRLASLGANVAFNYQASDEKARALETELIALGVKVKASKIDIKSYADVKAWVDGAREEFGGLEIVVNNAGVIADKALMMMSPEDWSKVIDTNLTGMFNASRAAIVGMMKQKNGVIVNISSVSGVIGLPKQVNYSASKGGMNAFTKALAKEVAGFGIRVNAIAPGYIDTEILSGFNEEQHKRISESVPLGRIGAVDDVAGVVEFLVSDQARYVTGQILVVDGGLAIR